MKSQERGLDSESGFTVQLGTENISGLQCQVKLFWHWHGVRSNLSRGRTESHGEGEECQSCLRQVESASLA
jgi:hypothetical protein